MSAPQRALCVVLHDVAPPTWPACRWMLDTLAQAGDFPVTLLAVPQYHGAPRSRAFERWLVERAERGDEIALHGFDHVDGGRPHGLIDRLRRCVLTRGEGEFADLDFDTATQRIEAGTEWLRELELEPAGFIAPAWLLGPEAWRALRRQPFEYTCTLSHIHRLDPARPVGPTPKLPCQSQVFSNSSAWRQRVSVVWNETLAWQQRDQPIVRLELHPGDDVPRVRNCWERLLHRQAATRRLSTLRDVVRGLGVRREPAPTLP